MRNVLSWEFIAKFSKQKDLRESGDILNRKEKLWNRKTSRSDKKAFPALKYSEYLLKVYKTEQVYQLKFLNKKEQQHFQL